MRMCMCDGCGVEWESESLEETGLGDFCFDCWKAMGIPEESGATTGHDDFMTDAEEFDDGGDDEDGDGDFDEAW